MFLLCAFLNLLLFFLNAAAFPTAISDTTFKSPILSFNPDDGYIFMPNNDPREEEIEAYGFVKQIEGLVSLLNNLGTCFNLASEPLARNVGIIDAALKKHPTTEVASLKKLIEDREEGNSVRIATRKLLLALKFVTVALRQNLDNHVEISTAFQQSYNMVLASEHNFYLQLAVCVTKALN